MNRTKNKFLYLRYYKFKESIALLLALFIDSIHRRIPRRLFIVKNTYQTLLLRGAKISRKNKEVIIDLHDFKYNLRLAGSDFEVFNHIILQDELKFVIKYASQLKKSALQIIDCGANIGLATLAIKKSFPKAKIISVEPESSNYIQLCKNISDNNLSDVVAIEAGVWYKKTTLVPDLEFRDKSNWAFALKEAGDREANGIPVDSLSNIAATVGWSNVDLLKIDIEGSEFEIFRNVDKWQAIFDTVKIISVEVHEEKGSASEIEEILIQNGFQLMHSGELLIGLRI